MSADDSLYRAVNSNDVNMVEMLINSEDFIITKEMFEWKDEAGRSQLHFAAFNGNVDLAAQLIKSGAKIDEVDSHGETPLRMAIRKGCPKMVAFLLDSRANVDEKTGAGLTPLFFAAENGEQEIADLLIQKGANVAEKDNWGNTALHSAIHFGYEDMAIFLMKKGVPIDEKSIGLVMRSKFEDLIEYMVLRYLPIDKNGIIIELPNNWSVWRAFLDPVYGVPDYIRLKIVKKILSDFDYPTISALTKVTYKNNFHAVDYTDPETREIIMRYFFFRHRYELLLNEAPVHISDTSIVIRAKDHGVFEDCLKHFKSTILDTDGGTSLSEEDFIDCVEATKLFAATVDATERSNEIKAAFTHFDRNNDKRIDLEEFKAFLRSTIMGKATRVVFKFMKDEHQYWKEVNTRKEIQTSKYVLNILGHWNAYTDEEFGSWLSKLPRVQDRSLADYRYCILMPEGDRSLHAIHMNELPDLNRVRTYLQDLASGLADLHASNVFHLDVKLLNALRVGGNRIVVIDMDASGGSRDHSNKSYAGAKFSSGVLPPEMFCQLDAKQLEMYETYWVAEKTLKSQLWRKVRPRRTSLSDTFVVKCFDAANPRPEALPYERVQASAAVDLWAFGVLMFQLLCRNAFLPVTADDDLASADAVATAAGWTDQKLSLHIDKSMKNFAGYEDAIDLLKQLLRSHPNDRLKSMTAVLRHPFFQTGNTDHLVHQIKGLAAAVGQVGSKVDIVQTTTELVYNRVDGVDSKVDDLIRKVGDIKEMSVQALRQIRVTEKVLLRGMFEKPDVPNCFVILTQKITEKSDPEKISDCLLTLEKAIKDVPSSLLSATSGLFGNNVVVYLYLVDEYTMKPVEGENYPIEINTAHHAEFLKCVLPLMRMSLKAVSACTAGGQLLQLLCGGKKSETAELGGALETIIGSLDEGKTVEELAAWAEDPSFTPEIRAKRVYGAAQAEFKKFVTDKGPKFCGLGLVEHKGYSCWTLEENRLKIEEEGLKEIEEDIKNCPYYQQVLRAKSEIVHVPWPPPVSNTTSTTNQVGADIISPFDTFL